MTTPSRGAEDPAFPLIERFELPETACVDRFPDG